MERPSVAVLRGFDLEARELALVDDMVRRRLITATVIGHRPTTGYGLGGVVAPIRFTRSLGGAVDRLPLGKTLRSGLEARLGRSLGPSREVPGLLNGYDVIYCREIFQHEALQAVHAPRVSDARVVVTCSENVPFRYEEDSIRRRIKRAVRESADLFLAKSDASRDALIIEGVPPDRILVVPHSVDVDRFSPGDPDEEILGHWGVPADGSSFVILYAGRLQREKGLVELLISARSLLVKRGDVRLVFQGRGPERARLEAAVETLGLAGRVTFGPWLDAGDMPRIYRSADLVVLPSLTTPYWREQFGFNLIEALACGRPVLGTDSGAIAEVIGDAGRVVPDYDRGELGSALDELVDDRAALEQYAGAARKRAVAQFSHEVVGDILRDAFVNALARDARRSSNALPRAGA